MVCGMEGIKVVIGDICGAPDLHGCYTEVAPCPLCGYYPEKYSDVVGVGEQDPKGYQATGILTGPEADKIYSKMQDEGIFSPSDFAVMASSHEKLLAKVASMETVAQKKSN